MLTATLSKTLQGPHHAGKAAWWDWDIRWTYNFNEGDIIVQEVFGRRNDGKGVPAREAGRFG